MAVSITLKRAPGAEANTHPLRSHFLRYSFNDLKDEPRPVLDGTSIFIRSVISNVLNELIRQVTVGTDNRYQEGVQSDN